MQQHRYATRADQLRSTVATHFRERTEEALSIVSLQANPGWSVGQRSKMERVDARMLLSSLNISFVGIEFLVHLVFL